MTPRERTMAVIKSVCIPLGVSPRDVIGKQRSRRVAIARHAACHALRQQGRSYPYAARSVGMKDHTTAIYACKVDITEARFRRKVNQMAIMAAVTIAMVGDA